MGGRESRRYRRSSEILRYALAEAKEIRKCGYDRYTQIAVLFDHGIVFSTSDEQYYAYAYPEVCQYSCEAGENIGKNDIAEWDWAEDAICDSSFERSTGRKIDLLSMVASFCSKKQKQETRVTDLINSMRSDFFSLSAGRKTRATARKSDIAAIIFPTADSPSPPAITWKPSTQHSPVHTARHAAS